jgi:acetate kinase
MIDALLVLNAGSSSIKFQAFGFRDLKVLTSGKVVRIGGAAQLQADLAGGDRTVRDLAAGADHDAAMGAIIEFIDRHDDGWRTVGVAHRIVHGGETYTAPVVVTPQVIADLRALSSLAPLHQPHNLAAIEAAGRLVGHVPQIACFDTAFHAGHGALFSSFALGHSLREKGIRRYGFHGLSYQWIAQVLSQDHPALHAGRVVVAHLGNGASLCAMQGGTSIDTTMGMTALDGLPMGTRCGALDPGALIYMLRDLGLDIGQVEEALYEQSGLKGLSGLTNDVEALLASDDPRAAFALDYFALRTAQYTAMMAVSLGGMDAMVFTGGIGEHATPVRNAIIERLRFLGPFETLVIPANEERMMAQQAKALLEASQAQSPV